MFINPRAPSPYDAIIKPESIFRPKVATSRGWGAGGGARGGGGGVDLDVRIVAK